MLPTAAETLPVGPDWRYEVKFDGYRMLAYVDTNAVQLISRQGIRHTEDFSGIVQDILEAVVRVPCVLDGELVALDSNGHPQLSLLRRREGIIAYFAFDLLELKGTSLVDRSLSERQKLLGKTLKKGERVFCSEEFKDGAALLEEVKRRRLEGVVAKRASSIYLPGRTRSWRKVKIRYAKK